MTNHTIYEGDGQTPESKLQENDVVVGDTIEVLTNNQLGYRKYRVILDANNNKSLSTIADWDMGIFEEQNDDDEYNGVTDDEQDGGKRRKRRSRKNRKSRRSKKSKKSRKTRKNRRH